MKNILTGFLALLTLLGGAYGISQNQQNPAVGVPLPGAPALFETILAAPISDSATSLTLAENSIRGGGSLSLFNCFTISEGSSQAEFICGDVAGTDVTNLVRGISPADGITTVADLAFAHRRGSSVQVTDFPVIQLLRAQNNGDETFENALKYASGVVPAGADELADVGYVLSVVSGGTVAFDQIVVTGTAGTTVAAGDIVYFNTTDQEWGLADIDTPETSTDAPIGIAQGAGTDNNAITNGVLILGLDTTQTGMTGGADIHLSSTAGDTTETASGLVLGRAKDADELYFNPKVSLTFTDNSWGGVNTFNAESIAGHNIIDLLTFESGTYTWTKDLGLEYVMIEMCAAGAGGAYAFDADNSESTAVPGGGAGGFLKKKILAADLPATVPVNVGVAGAGGTSGVSPEAGGGTNFYGFATTTGGAIASGAFNDTSLAPGGAGGTATGGDINIPGGNGYVGGQESGDNGRRYGIPGNGGTSFFGGEGAQCSGGRGGVDSNGLPGQTGLMIITEYY
jgi:hypothetical protein